LRRKKCSDNFAGRKLCCNFAPEKIKERLWDNQEHYIKGKDKQTTSDVKIGKVVFFL